MATVQEQEALEQATGPEVDDRFLRLMIAHHHGGFSWGRRSSTGARIRASGSSPAVVAAQRSEITEMQTARRRLGLPPAEAPAVPDHRGRSD